MQNKECKITCDGKEVGTFSCTENGFNMKLTEEGKEMCKEHKGCC